MAIDISSLRTTTSQTAARVLLYGPPGIGKTRLASEFPNPVFLQTEDGAPDGLELPTFGLLTTFDEVMDAITALATGEHDRQTVVLDSLDKLEPLVWARVCADNKWSSIEAPGYGKGYVEADAPWRDFLSGLNYLRRTRNMTIVLLAHSTVERFDSPTSASYSRYDVRLHKRALALVQDEVDAILFMNQDATIKTEDAGFNKKRTHAEGGGTRFIYAEGRPAWAAKNRFGIPEKLLYVRDEGFAALAPYLPGLSPAPVAEAAE